MLQDYVLAHIWLNLAAAKVHPEAATDHDILAAKMTPTQIAEAQRLARGGGASSKAISTYD